MEGNLVPSSFDCKWLVDFDEGTWHGCGLECEALNGKGMDD